MQQPVNLPDGLRDDTILDIAGLARRQISEQLTSSSTSHGSFSQSLKVFAAVLLCPMIEDMKVMILCVHQVTACCVVYQTSAL